MMKTKLETSFWVFAYGSLMWNPERPFLETKRAFLPGWSRALCIFSTLYRGTEEHPGLTLGLDRGDGCDGMAYLYDPSMYDALDAREMIGDVYTPTIAPIHLEDGRDVPALFYVARMESPYYAGHISDEDRIAILQTAQGARGTSYDYLAETIAFMNQAGFPDPALSQLLHRATQEF